jgi:outer membrane protein OmpA-like peptidoglycan-associated protein/tetratricopeptide (TPR) repeat protein
MKYFEEALGKDSGFYEALDYLSRLYYQEGDMNASLQAMYKMVEIAPNKRPADWYYIGRLEKENQNYEKALEAFNTYLNYRENNFDRNEIAVRMKDDCEFALVAMKNPVPYEPVNMGPMINTEYPEYLPCLTADDQLLLFTRRINDSRAPEGMQDNLYYTVKGDDEYWQQALPLDAINTVYNEGAASISADGNTLVFTACAFYGEYGNGREGFGSCDLFITFERGNGWTRPENLGSSINSASWESQPSLSADGNTLYFIRAPKKRDAEANQEIYVSYKEENGNWSRAEKLPATINTPYREETVLIHPDGHTLYFSSNGHPGMGGLDIYLSRKDEKGNWGEAKNLGYPINTPNDENSLMVSTSGELAYFSSNMEGGFGSFDLYSFELYPEARPLEVTYMKGKVYDKETLKALGANFELIDLESGETVYSAQADAYTGEFLIPITYGKDYALNAEEEGYLFYSENFQMKENHSNEPYIMNVPMLKLLVGSELVLRNVFFETDQYDLKSESKVELNKLVVFLEMNPSVKIEVEGHTDDQGNAAHNKTLSDNRAKSVYTYLIDNGISKDRLNYKGFGADQPLSSNDTEEGRANNRRTSVRIIAK